jgi:hypothetical protein
LHTGNIVEHCILKAFVEAWIENFYYNRPYLKLTDSSLFFILNLLRISGASILLCLTRELKNSKEINCFDFYFDEIKKHKRTFALTRYATSTIVRCCRKEKKCEFKCKYLNKSSFHNPYLSIFNTENK